MELSEGDLEEAVGLSGESLPKVTKARNAPESFAEDRVHRRGASDRSGWGGLLCGEVELGYD